jgi:hypothetical protein
VIAQPEVKFLGYVLYTMGVSASSDKVDAVTDYPTHRKAKDIRAFLKLASFYRRLVANFSETAKPLTNLTRKGLELNWSPSQRGIQ